MNFDLSRPGAIDALLAYHRAVFGGARMELEGDPPPNDLGDPPPNDLGDAGKRALDEERKARRDAARAAKAEKERADALAAQLAEIERAQMTDQERAAAERDDWRKKYEEQAAQLAARDLDILRRDVADEKGLNPGLARRLRGATREELETDADELKSMFHVDSPGRDTPGVLRPDPSAGATGGGGKPTSVAEVMRDIRAKQQHQK